MSEFGMSYSPAGADGQLGNLVLKGCLTAQAKEDIGGLDYGRLVLDFGSWPNLSAISDKPIQAMLIRGQEIDWETINSLEHLTVLELETSDSIEIDAQLMSRLRYLQVSWRADTSSWLQKSSSLRALSVTGGIPSLRALEGLEALEALQVIQSTRLNSLDGIERPNLSFAEFQRCGKLSDIAGAASAGALKCLNILHCKEVSTIRQLAEVESLTEVFLDIGEVRSLLPLSSTAVEKLSFICKVQDGNLDSLYDMPALTFCQFEKQKNFSRSLSEIQGFLEKKGFDQRQLRSSLSRFPRASTFV